MGPSEPAGKSPGNATRPRWSVVLRALREARGVTLEGWGALIGVSRTTVQRWERGERAPDPGAEAAILTYCREAGLFRSYDRGPLSGHPLTADALQGLLAEARWRVSGTPADAAPSGALPAALQPDTTPQRRAPSSPSNLPVSLTSFVGRERELATVRRVQAGTRLLTLTGAGGCGKTRLALALAEELLWAYPHGIWFVDLAPLSDSALVPLTVSSTLKLRATGPQPLIEALIEAITPRHLLLLLDNCEHVLPACAELADTLLRACPHLEVLATSRQSLGVGGETVWRVPPMALPDQPPADTQSGAGTGGTATTDAVRLFVERARLQRPDLTLSPGDTEAVADICRRLDGIPLAIELAAARVSALSVAQIADRLHDRFRLLTAGSRTALPRHQTLRAVMDWSYDPLTAPERTLLCRLSVFAGGLSLEAAEAVCGEKDGSALPRPAARESSLQPLPNSEVLDLLTRLVDKSLVGAEHGGVVRFRMLETVRRYAAEKLDESGEATAVRERHVSWCLALAEAAEAKMYGPHEAEWLSRLEDEHDNLRAALAESLEGDERLREAGLRLAGALGRFWDLGGHVSEGRRWLTRLLGTTDAETIGRARALGSVGTLASIQGDLATAYALFEESLSLCRTVGDEDGIAHAEVNLGKIAYRRGEYALARRFLEASLARSTECRNGPVTATAQNALGQIALRQGDCDRARVCFEASLAIQRAMGNKHGIALNLDDLATVAAELGDNELQAVTLEESLALFRELGHKSGIALVLGDYGTMAWLRGDYEQAAALMQESLTLYQEVGERQSIARVRGYQSLAALYQSDYAQAEALVRECLTLYREAGDTWAIGRYLPVLAGVLFGRGRVERAASLFGAAAALCERLGAPLPMAVRPDHDRATAAVRRALGEPAFEAAWHAGWATPEETLAYALGPSVDT
jgi:non-specific serine/threonine protein kinase